MFRKRGFLMGLGIGLVVSSLIFGFFNGAFSQNASETVTEEEWTLEKLTEIATANNLKIFTEDEVNQLKEEYAISQVAEKLKELQDEQAEDNSAVPSEQQVAPEEEVSKSFTIKKGLDSYEVADYLTEIGVLTERDKFIKLLYNYKLTTRIGADTYNYSTSITTEELIELITGVKVD